MIRRGRCLWWSCSEGFLGQDFTHLSGRRGGSRKFSFLCKYFSFAVVVFLATRLAEGEPRHIFKGASARGGLLPPSPPYHKGEGEKHRAQYVYSNVKSGLLDIRRLLTHLHQQFLLILTSTISISSILQKSTYF